MLPDDLRERKQFVCWRYEATGKGKPTKVPYNPITGKRASTTSPDDWVSYNAAKSGVGQKLYDGFGFVFTEHDNYVGIDLDHCVTDDGVMQPWADNIVKSLNSYTEWSPSGAGVHIIVEGVLPEGRRKFGPVEMYDAERYFTVTERPLDSVSPKVENRTMEVVRLHEQMLADDVLLERARAAANGKQFTALWRGDTDGYPSHSEADLALASALAFWTRGDRGRVDRLFRLSGLFREKWDELRGNQTYGEKTLEQVCRKYDEEREKKAHELQEISSTLPEERRVSLATAEMTETGDAECFVAMYGECFKYLYERERWLQWNGVVWRDYEGNLPRTEMTEVVRARRKVSATIDDPETGLALYGHALKGESANRQRNSLAIASEKPQIRVRLDMFDADDMIIALQNGVYDLRTEEFREARREDMLSMQAGAAYDPKATCPRWETFLREVFNDSADLIAYIQRAVGYSLTGSTNEQKLFLFVGNGSNGKSTFLSIIAKLLGNYAGHAAFSVFDADNKNGSTEDLARLRGKRIVSVIESDENRRLAEGRVKSVTGGDTISAAFKYGHVFDYEPDYKVWFAVNRRPNITGTDNGIWRRIETIQFERTFDEHTKDRGLEEKLAAELPGILNWALAGAKAWRQQGLGTCEEIQRWNTAYRKDSNRVAQWLVDCTAKQDGGHMVAIVAYESYKRWSEQRGDRPLTMPSWRQRMRECGHDETRISKPNGRGRREIEVEVYEGVTLDEPNDAFYN